MWVFTDSWVAVCSAAATVKKTLPPGASLVFNENRFSQLLSNVSAIYLNWPYTYIHKKSLARFANNSFKAGYDVPTLDIESNLIYNCLEKFVISNEPQHDKTNRMTCAPSEVSDQPGHPLSLIRVFAGRMKKACIRNYQLSAQRRLIHPGWTEASLGAQVILLVLSCCGSND